MVEHFRTKDGKFRMSLKVWYIPQTRYTSCKFQATRSQKIKVSSTMSVLLEKHGVLQVFIAVHNAVFSPKFFKEKRGPVVKWGKYPGTRG